MYVNINLNATHGIGFPANTERTLKCSNPLFLPEALAPDSGRSPDNSTQNNF